MSLVNNRFGEKGLYILGEPEAALSPQRQLSLLCAIDRLARLEACQFIIATHSPIILAYPDAKILCLSENGMEEVESSRRNTSPSLVTSCSTVTATSSGCSRISDSSRTFLSGDQ
jgi:predicted ATPase